MSLPAFYLPPGAWGKECALNGEEAHHANVLRLAPGEEIMILDGRGHLGICRILNSDRKTIALELMREWIEPMPESRPIVAIALGKAARRGFFLEKAAELGAWAVWLWQAERSQGLITAKLAESCMSQLRAGAKQCHNPWFPQLCSLGGATQLAEQAQIADTRILPWEDKAGEPVIAYSQIGQPGLTVYAIGPEGGMTKDEVNCLESSRFVTVSLGSRVLRCETAATLCLGLHWWASQWRSYS